MHTTRHYQWAVMMKKSDTDWTTATSRVKWLLEHRYSGSRSAMAKATGVSLTGLIKVVTDQQTPGRRLMEKVIENTDVSPAWLSAGEGQPLKGSAIPVAAGCLPGPPTKWYGFLTEERVPEMADLYAPSRYWLKLGATEPVVKASRTTFRLGDLLLMDTDRLTFPPVEQLSGRWCVVRIPGRESPHVQLAELSYFEQSIDNGPAHLEAETFEYHPLVMTRVTVDLYPNGQVEASGRTVRLEQPKRNESKPSKQRWAATILSHQVGYEDVVAVCALFVRRFG